MLKRFRRWLLKILFGFDIIEQLEDQARLLDITASVAADGLTIKGAAKEQFIETTAKLFMSQQDSILELQEAMSKMLKTVEIHQKALEELLGKRVKETSKTVPKKTDKKLN